MPAFILIGVGLNPGRHLTLEALDAIKSADRVFAEVYTTKMPDPWIENIETLTGKKVEPLERDDVESQKSILSSCKKGDTVMLVPGDALTATTHIHLIDEAERLGIDVRVLPGVSILTVAPGLLGLQAYKFGRTVSLPRWRPGFEPISPLENIIENLKSGLHTLVLLDTEPDPMTASEGAGQLLRMARVSGTCHLTETTMVCVIVRACLDNQRILYLSLAGVRDRDFGPPPHCIVIPGALHFMEKQRLEKFRVQTSTHEPLMTNH